MARDFPGSAGNYLVLSNPIGALDVTGETMTIAAMVKLDTTTAPRPFVAKRIAGGIQYLFRIKSSTVRQLSFFIGGGEVLGATVFAAPTAWLSVIAVHEGAGSNQAKVYLNGVQDGQGTLAASPDTTADFTLGFDSVEAAYLDGLEGAVAIWTDGLTPAEVFAISRGVSPFRVHPRNLIGLWPCFGVGNVGEPDLSGQAQHLTKVGTLPLADGPPIGRLW